MPREMVDRLFPNLDEVLAWHDKYNKQMKDRVKSDGLPVKKVADILGEMVRNNGHYGCNVQSESHLRT